MTTQLKVSADDVQSTATQLTTSATQLEELVQKVSTDVQALNASWSGSASASMQEAYSQFHSGALQMTEALGAIATGLHKTSQVYSETENALTTGWHVS